ncbi:hypothetical protein QCA50_011156 [Cerrena zonata]|uniref:Uncharacterized protein n=1 Tax=Cerrena zonata TaxID=2478898 RepID=A0AAW0G9U6_9APHY
MAAENSRVMDRMLSREIKPILLLPPASSFCVTSPSSTATSMLAVMSIPHRMLNTPPPSAQKRPRGLWKGRRLPADSTKLARNTHDDSPNLTDEDDNRCDTTTLTEVCYDDDLDDARSSSSSSSKRRRVSGGFSDYSCHSGSASRALSPELCHAPNALKPFSVGSMGDSTRLTARTTSTSSSGRPNPSTSDLEDWDNLKALFAKATDLCENESLEALPFLRAVIRECTRILTKHSDPSIIFTGRRNQQSNYSPVQVVTPTEERLHRDWGNETFEAALRTNIMKSKRPASRSEDLPTALHAIFGIALFYMGNIVAQDPSLVLPGEPSSAVTYWLAALDVFETGESLPCFIDGRGSNETNEDWRMAISWGRTLVSLADEKVNSIQRARAEAEARAGAGVPAKAFPSSWSHMSTPGPFS